MSFRAPGKALGMTSTSRVFNAWSGGLFVRNRIRCGSRRQADWRQPHQQQRAVVGGDPGRLGLAAAEALVQDHLLAVTSLDEPSWPHQRLARTSAVARSLQVDVKRVQAVRAVVSVAPAGGGCADELPALPAAECLVGLRARRPATRFRRGCRSILWLSMPTRGAIFEREVVGGQVVKVV